MAVWASDWPINKVKAQTGGGGGGTQQLFIQGGSTPRSNPLPFYIPFFAEKGTPFIYLLLTNVTLFTYLV